MSLLIKGEEMPDRCTNCLLFDWRYRSASEMSPRIAYCRVTHETLGIYKPFEEKLLKSPEHCPLVEVPTPHGRLIDADKLKQEHIEAERGAYGDKFVIGDNRFMKRFADAPTVIESEE